MSKRTVKSWEIKKYVVTSEDSVYVGLDVHKVSVYAAVRVNGREVDTWVMPMSVQVVVRTIRRFKAGLKQVVYEAGPTGYGLARALRKAGLPTEVIAPGKTPQPANPDDKSDRLDCRKLAEFAEKELLKPVAIPTEEEEADRQVLRLRDQLTRKNRRVKQQIKSLLLQYGIPQPEGLRYWSKLGIDGLGQLDLRPEIRLALDSLVIELLYLAHLLQETDAAMRRISRKPVYKEKEARLRTHPGVGATTAMAYLVEIYRPERFKNEQALAKYLGLAPRVSRTGNTVRRGALIKAGRDSLRAFLVEASWVWIRADPHAKEVFNRIWHKTGKKQTAIIAMARKMATNLWYMLIREEDYRSAA